MSPQMQQALYLMQVPVMELALVIQEEMEQNPLLEYSEEEEPLDEDEGERKADEDPTIEAELIFDDKDFEILKHLDEEFDDHFAGSETEQITRTAEQQQRQTFLEQSIPFRKSLFEHLMQQAKETFETEEELEISEAIIGNVDENGFLWVPLREIAILGDWAESQLEKVLREIQTFEPFGVGACSLQEAFLIQLRCRHQENTLAYRIIDQHWEDLLHNNILAIKKKLKRPLHEIKEAIDRRISLLDFRPGAFYSNLTVQSITPDVSLVLNDNQLAVVINDQDLPTLRFNSRYLRMLEDDNLPKETKDFIRNKIMSARWLLKNIDQRNNTLRRIVEVLAKYQEGFFLDPKGTLTPLTMKAIAEELGVHESTITRAVANKYLDSPRGLFPLRDFFSYAYMTSEGQEMSSKTVRQLLKEMIADENKQKPLSDDAISQLLKGRGIICARRTVAKYRSEMGIGNTKQRRQF